MSIRGRSAYHEQYRVGRSDFSLGVCAEDGKYVVAGRQVLGGKLWRSLGDFLNLCCAVVEDQFLPIGKLAGIDDDGDI